MPRTRPDLSRDEKLEEILAIAESRLRDGGYEALSVAAIARELDIAQNAIYWYFPSKDHLFVVALERILRQTVAGKPSKKVGTVERILWFTDRFEPLSELRAAMNKRAQSARVVAEFVEQLEATLSRMLATALRDHVPPEDLELAVESFRATVEGTFVKGLDKLERRKVLTYALRRIADSGR